MRSNEMTRLRLLVVAVVSTLSLASSAIGQQSSTLGLSLNGSTHAEMIHFLSDLVKIDTSNPPGNEIKAAEYFKSVLDKEGIASEIFESALARANLVARLKGNGSKRPLLLMGHLDVVGVERDKWTMDPFAAVEKGGYLYGRGSLDDKSMGAANLEVFLELHRRKVPLDRDVILL